MCAILDASVVAAVFQPDPAPGAREFRRWIESGRGTLVVGGKLRKELSTNEAFKAWLRQAILRGSATSVPDSQVDRDARSLGTEVACQSNDEHVLALARVSGARLLYSRDEALREDFKDVRLLADPRGKLYPETKGPECRRWLLQQRRLCAN